MFEQYNLSIRLLKTRAAQVDYIEQQNLEYHYADIIAK